MIIVTRLGGHRLALNSDLIERAEATPDTVLTLVDGTRYVVLETLEELVDTIVAFRAEIVDRAARLAASDTSHEAHVLQLVPLTER